MNSTLAILYSLCGLAVAGGGGLLIHTLRFLARATHVEGEVVRLIVHRTKLGDRIRPVVEFRCDGAPVQFETQLARGPDAFQVGDRVPVAFDPGDPLKARMTRRLNLWLLPSALVGLGLFVAILALVLSSLAPPPP